MTVSDRPPELLVNTAPTPLAGMPPLLFLHGAYTAAWCWHEHYLPFFAQAGFNAYALSFSGHGQTPRRELLDSYSIDDYVDDVVAAIARLPAAPVLIGHSMGGFVVQKYLERFTAPAAALLCSVPPQGLAASAVSMFFGKPHLLVEFNRLMSGGNVAPDSLREALFSQPVPADALTRYLRLSQPESHRAIWDMMLFNLPRPEQVLTHLPSRAHLYVAGAQHDLIIPPSLVEMTARSYGVPATLHPALGHGLMLETGWNEPAEHLAGWLKERLT